MLFLHRLPPMCFLMKILLNNPLLMSERMVMIILLLIMMWITKNCGKFLLGVPLGGTRRVGGLLGVAERLSGTVSPFRAEQGTSLETPSRAR